MQHKLLAESTGTDDFLDRTSKEFVKDIMGRMRAGMLPEIMSFTDKSKDLMSFNKEVRDTAETYGISTSAALFFHAKFQEPRTTLDRLSFLARYSSNSADKSVLFMDLLDTIQLRYELQMNHILKLAARTHVPMSELAAMDLKDLWRTELVLLNMK